MLWLKSNNPIYSNIVLLKSLDNLLHSKLQDVEFQEENNHEIVDQIQDEIDGIGKLSTREKERKALTQRSQSDRYYEQFTISYA